MHNLPFFGLLGRFWRSLDQSSRPEGEYFVPSSVDWKVRPFKGVVRGTQFMDGFPVRSSVSAVNKNRGRWLYEPPADGHKLYFRPLFPNSVAEQRAEAAKLEAGINSEQPEEEERTS